MLQSLTTPVAFVIYFLVLQTVLGLAVKRLQPSKLRDVLETVHATLPFAFAHMPFAAALGSVPSWVKDLLARLGTMALSMLFALVLVVGPLGGCKTLTPPQVSRIETVATDAGCELVPVVDASSGATVAAVCEAIAPTVVATITKWIGDLTAKGVKAGMTSETFVALSQNGHGVGYARADVASVIQAKLDGK